MEKESFEGNQTEVERGKCEIVFTVKAHGQYSKGDSCSFRHDTMAFGNRAESETKKTIVFSCIPFEGENRPTAVIWKTHWTRLNVHADSSPVENCDVSCGILLCVRITYLRKVVQMAPNAISDTLKQDPATKSNNGVARGTVVMLKVSIQFGCHLKIFTRKSIF